VRSARYAGEYATDAENVARLLDELGAVADDARPAAFRCALALAWPDGTLIEAEGRCEGWIARAPRGTGGFGYDPVFVDPASGRTFAELPAAAKNALSHRRRALDSLRLGLAQRTRA
jgi:XTP/dITP diphosphohydrolase